MKSLNKERTVAMGISWATIVLQILISLFFVPFFLNKVGDKQYGLYSFSLSVISWIDTLVITIGAAYYKFLNREKEKYSDYGESRALGVFFKIFLFVSLFILVFGAIFDGLIFLRVIDLSEFADNEVFQISAIVLLSIISSIITSLLTVGKSYPYYKQKYIFSYLLPLIQVILQTSLSVLFLKLGFGVVCVSAIHFGVLALVSLVQFLFSKFSFGMNVSIKSLDESDKLYRKQLTKEILQFTFFILIITIVDILNKNIDKVLLGFYNADLVSTYQLAFIIPSYLVNFTNIIPVLFNQQINNEYSKGDLEGKIDQIYVNSSKIQTIITLLLVGGFIAVGKEFVFLWLDESRIKVFYYALVLMILYSFTCSNSLNIYIRSTKEVHKKSSLIYLGVIIFNIILSIILLNIFKKELAIEACLIGTIVSYIVGQVIIMQIYDYKVTKLNVKKVFINYAFYFAFAIVCGGLTHLLWLFNPVSNIVLLIVKGFIFVLLYFVCLIIKDRAFLKRTISKIFKK